MVLSLRAKLRLGLTFLLGIGVGVVLQGCVVGSVAIPTGGVTVGGGVTGRWEGTISDWWAFTCIFEGSTQLFVVFIEDSNGNLTGSIGAVNKPRAPYLCQTPALLGKREGQTINFAADTAMFTGTLLDSNTITGTFTSSHGSGTGTWSVQRVPPIP